MWEWLKSWFRYKQVTSEELPHVLVLEEALRQCHDAWTEDRELLNGARLELKTARKKIEELEDIIISKDKKTDQLLWIQQNTNDLKDAQIKAGDLGRKEMQERIDELENEVHNLTVQRNEYKARLQNVLNQI